MSLIVSAKGSGGLPPVSEGNHVGICIGLYDIGVHYNERFEKSSPKAVSYTHLDVYKRQDYNI